MPLTTASGNVAAAEGAAEGVSDAGDDAEGAVVGVATPDATGDGVISPHEASSAAATRRVTAREIALGFTPLS
jgi:hypothetical protein